MTARTNRRTARRVALGYAAGVLAVFVVAAVLHVLHDGPDASFAPVLAIVAALPASLVVLLLPDLDPPWNAITATAALVAAVLVQAWLLWLLLRGRRRG